MFLAFIFFGSIILKCLASFMSSRLKGLHLQLMVFQRFQLPSSEDQALGHSPLDQVVTAFYSTAGSISHN
jgi:hypothetical protein